MKPKVTLYIATSIDGYIAGKNDALDWLDSMEHGEEDYGYGEFYDSADGLIMGSRTYEIIRSFGEWPYKGKVSRICSSRDLELPGDGDILLAGSPEEALTSFEQEGRKHIWLVGGGALVSYFLERDLLHEIIWSIVPVFLGEGVPLFPVFEPAQCSFDLESSSAFESGMVQIVYKRKD